jgi:putative flavoprotein involved in K+ transport
MNRFNTIVVGAGQAGLSASHELHRRGVEHVVLDRSVRPAGRWPDRWNSFCLVTINENCRLPGLPYDGDQPDGFMTRDEVVAYLGRYAKSFNAPVEYGVDVRGIRPGTGADRWLVSTSAGTLSARTVVVATGPFQHPKVPSWAECLPEPVHQLHSDAYVSPECVPDGPTLVVGTGQSGAQIAEELHAAGRRVYLGVSRCGRRPRRYRGRDIHAWVALMRRQATQQGTLRTVRDLGSPRERFTCNPHLSGRNGGHEINLRRLATSGVVLLGRPSGIRGGTLLLDPDLIANLEGADAAAAQSRRIIDEFICACGIDAPEDDVIEPVLPDPVVLSELTLDEAQIRTVIWATGYRLDFSWIDVPGLCDAHGYPWHDRGVTPYPGLSFLGLPWLHTEASSLLLGMETDAPHLVAQLTSTAIN